MAVSRDQGKTWTDRQTVGTEFGIQNAVFPTVVAGDDDRASIAYLGTPTGGNYQDNANFHGVWHLYVDTTYDGGKTWVTSDATPNDPVQVGSICTGGTTCGDDRNLLDFIDVTTDDHGRVEVGVRRRLHQRLRHATRSTWAATPTPRSPGRAAARRCSRRTTRR